jgi:Fe-Mn family superoxide dismutase
MTAKASASQSDATSDRPLQHVLPPLPYGYSALEACIDARTMTLHHDKHHAGYVDKLNELLLPYPELHKRSARWLVLNADSIPEVIRTGVQHNAGGHLNHSLLWQAMSPSGGAGPTGALSSAINTAFGSLRQFQTHFEEAAAALFGSGWVWLVIESGKQTGVPRLQIVTTSGHDNPQQQGQYPLLVNDVWEHAYYLRYENRRPDYLKSWWSIVNWKDVVHRFEHPDEPDHI